MPAKEDSMASDSKECSADLILCRPVTHLPALMQRLLCHCFPCMQSTAWLSLSEMPQGMLGLLMLHFEGFTVLLSRWACSCSMACALCMSMTCVAVFAERAQEVKQNSTGRMVSPGSIVPALAEQQMLQGSFCSSLLRESPEEVVGGI